MDLFPYLQIAVFAIWCLAEIFISWRSQRNQAMVASQRKDSLSYVVMWLSIIPTLGFAIIVRAHTNFVNRVGSFSDWTRPLGYAGCLIVVLGVSIRLVAVATLRRQFTDRVSIVQNHELVDCGIYKRIRHPAYLGHLLSLFGLGLISGNGFALAALAVIPVAATLYRIHIEETVLLSHFGVKYQEYANRTKRLLPGIY